MTPPVLHNVALLGMAHGPALLRAAINLVATLVIAKLVDSLLKRHSARVGRVLGRSREVDQGETTRLRMSRRLVVFAIVFVGLAIALVQLPFVGTLARAMLASAGITAIVVGFAARSGIANLVSGVTIVFSQPVRIGDYVAVDDTYGTIEEIALMYTYIRTADNRRLVIPNEVFASKVIHNYTLVDPVSAIEVEFAVPVHGAIDAVRRVALEEAARVAPPPEGRENGVDVLDFDSQSVRLRLNAWAPDGVRRRGLACELRGALLQRLKDDGLLE
jgi:small-conductance mechanosensitive channel